MPLTSLDRIAFSSYSYFNKFMNYALDLVPPILRTYVLRVFLGKLGGHSLIDYGVYFRYMNKIKIGNNVEINRGCEFYPSYKFKASFIVIGDNTIIGPNVKFYGAGQNRHGPNLDHVSSSITVGTNVYIGGDVIIRYGVTIGNNAVIGAGTIVSNNIESGAVVVSPRNRSLGSD